MMNADTLPCPAGWFAYALLSPNSRNRTAGVIIAKMTVRRFRSSRRISSLSTVRLKPPRPGAVRALTSGTGSGLGGHRGPPAVVAAVVGVVAGQGDESVLETASGDLQVAGRGLGQQVTGHRVAVAGVHQDGLAAHLDALRAGNGEQRGLVGAGHRDADRPARRHRLDLRRGAVGDNLAVPEQDDPVGVGVRLLQVVRGEQHGAAAGGILPDRGPEAAPALHVHPGGRLVQDEQFRVGQQGHGEAQPLLLTAGALAHQPVRDGRDPGPLQHLGHRPGVW